MKMKFRRQAFWKVVNYNPGSKELTVLEEVFRYEDGYKGACGAMFYAISREDYEERTSYESVLEYLEDCTSSPAFGSFERWAEAIMQNGEAGDVMFDLSYRNHWDEFREQLGLSEDEAYIFDCVGGGRMFSADYQGNMNPKCCKIIREYESK